MERWLGLLIRLYPPEFRRRYGEAMIDLFRQEQIDAAALPRKDRCLLLARVWIDLLITAGRAWLAALEPDTRPTAAAQRSTSMDRLSQDVRYALRSFARRPGFTAVVVATLALGIGANTAIFTLVNEVVLRPLQIGEPNRVVDLVAEVPGGNSFTGFSYADYLEYSDRSSEVLEGVAAYSARRLRLGSGIDAEPVVAQLTTPSYFAVVAVAPTLGTALEPGGDTSVAVISHAFWQSRFGGDPDVLGSTLRLNGTPFTVIGVGPEGFAGTFIGYPTEMWLPLRAGEGILPGFELDDPSMRGLEFIGRLAPGVDREQAQAGLDVLAAQLERQYPVRNRGLEVAVHSTTGVDQSMRGGVLGFLGLLMVVAALVLLITCLNVGGMLLVRAAARRKEMSIRFAMGAGAGRLTRQLLTETLVVFTLGGALGAFVAARSTDLLLAASLSDLPAPRGLELGIDWRVLLFTAAAALVASLVAGLFPAREALRQDLVAGLGSSRGSGGREEGRLRSVFVVAQIAAAVALLIGAGLFLRSLRQGQTLDPGFEADLVAAARLILPEDEFDPQRGLSSFAQLEENLARIPGVESVAVAQRRPIGVVKNPIELEIVGAPAPADGSRLVVDGNSVSAEYFHTVGLPLLAGRAFRPEEGLDHPRVAIVNETMARRFWSREDAVGQQLLVDGERITVVGVAADSRYLIQDDTPLAHMYFPISQDYSPRVAVLVRSAGDPMLLQRELRQELLAIVPSRHPGSFTTLRGVIDRSLLPQRIASAVMMALGTFGLLLACLGIYGVLAHGVHQRTREIGIRMALGGRRQEVVGLVIVSGLRLVALGIVAGAALAVALAPLAGRFLIGVGPVDLPTLVVVTAVFLGVGGLACTGPAPRAARIDPVRSLRLD
ncbi:MAG: ABC transporter permease [Holophagales bacterium]|nr:ABC transporter permease [Holophagales bacterium]